MTKSDGLQSDESYESGNVQNINASIMYQRVRTTYLGRINTNINQGPYPNGTNTWTKRQIWHRRWVHCMEYHGGLESLLSMKPSDPMPIPQDLQITVPRGRRILFLTTSGHFRDRFPLVKPLKGDYILPWLRERTASRRSFIMNWLVNIFVKGYMIEGFISMLYRILLIYCLKS